MKKLISVLLVAVMVCSIAACSSSAEKTVSFADPLLESMVRAAMNKPEGDISIAEAEAMTELQLGVDWQPEPAPNSQITDISGLEHFINLEDLNLSFHSITDITPLAKLTKLKQLSLGGNPVADISPLSGLTELEFLLLFNCQAQDYSPLANLTKLGGLLLDHSTIDDVSMLFGLTELWWLGLSNTQVSDVSPLAGLTNLRQLQLAGCPISDYTPLAAIYPNLEDKDFSIVSSLRELGFMVRGDADQMEAYKTDEMYILINRAEWGKSDNKDAVNGVLLCKNHGTDKEITVAFYPDQKSFLVSSEQGDFRYTYNLKSEEMNVELGDWDALGAFIEKAYVEVDPYLQLTPIKDFDRVMTETFGVSANTLYTLPRESEAPPEQLVASENSLIGLGFGFDDAGTCGVYEQREPHYASVAIHRSEWGDWNDDWDIELTDTDVNGYSLRVTYHPDGLEYDPGKAMYHISADKNDGTVSASYDYYPATGEYGGYPDDVPAVFNAVFDTQGDGFQDKPLAHFEQWVMKLFGKNVDELYALPKQ